VQTTGAARSLELPADGLQRRYHEFGGRYKMWQGIWTMVTTTVAGNPYGKNLSQSVMQF
jgi:hypothetical protein